MNPYEFVPDETKVALKEIEYEDSFLWQTVIAWFFTEHKLAICVIPTDDTYDSVIGFIVRILDRNAEGLWYFDIDGNAYDHEPKRENYFDVLDLSICEAAIKKAITLIKTK